MSDAITLAATPITLAKADALAADASPPVDLEVLFSEIITFANHLRRAKALLHRQDSFRVGAMGVLQALAQHGARTVSQIGRMRLTSRQNIQILVNHLAAAGHVSLASNPAHKRSGLVVLTESGRALLGAMKVREDQFLTDLATRVPAPEVRSAALVLQQVRQLLPGTDERAEKPATRRKGRRAARGTGKFGSLPDHPPMAEVLPVGPEPELAENEFPFNLL